MAAQTRGKILGRLLVEAKLLTEEQLQRAIELQSKTGQELTDALVALQFVDYEEIAVAMSLYYNVPFISLKRTPVNPEAVKLIPEVMARKHVAIPVSVERDGLLVVMKDVGDVQAIDEMAAHANMRVKPAVGVTGEILNAIDINYKAIGEIEKEIRKIPSYT
ncbi:MAG: type II secretion system protein GspE, partial [Dehalococcoidia bacterium]|nr:type II secretion system protein GspE [Dehalococcoidia bacterium]